MEFKKIWNEIKRALKRSKEIRRIIKKSKKGKYVRTEKGRMRKDRKLESR